MSSMMMMLQVKVQPMEAGGESRCSSSSTMDEDPVRCGWNSRAPVTPVYDWGQFSSDDDFHGLIESMICEDSDAMEAALSQKLSPCSSFRSCTTTETDTPTSIGKKDSSSSSPELSIEKSLASLPEDGRGLRLVHLLMAAAEAMTGPHKSRELAKVILVRLKEMVPAAAAAGGSNMERLAGHFTDALLCLLDGGAGGRQSATPHREEQHHPGDVLAAFQLLQDMSPYVKFGHFTANQAILEAVAGERRVHIIDYDIMEGVQWASLIQALVSRGGGGLPPAHLRITAVTRGGAGRRGLGTVQETGRRLVAFAASVGQPFSFGQCRVDADDQFRPAGVKVVKGEVVVANCVLQPPQAARKSVASFLTGVAALGARVVAVVEEESEAAVEGGFVARFMEELQRYSAVWDSLEAGFPMQGRARGLVEKVVLGPRIAGAVAAAFRDGEKGGGWGESMAGMGYGRVGISWFNHCQARLLLGLFNDGYRVEEAAPNKLVLAWKARRLLSASVWAAPTGAGEGAGPLC